LLLKIQHLLGKGGKNPPIILITVAGGLPWINLPQPDRSKMGAPATAGYPQLPRVKKTLNLPFSPLPRAQEAHVSNIIPVYNILDIHTFQYIKWIKYFLQILDVGQR